MGRHSAKASSITTAIQPRVGARFGDSTEFWVGGYFIEADESHSGTIDLNLGPLIPIPGDDIGFAVDLSQAKDFNFSVGTHMAFNDAWEATVEVGAGDRSTVLANFTFRFE